MATVVVVSRISLYREGLISLLSQAGDVSVRGQAGCLGEAVDLLQRVRPEVALVDLALPEGLEGVGTLSTRFPQVRVLALGVEENPNAIADCAEVGVSGFVYRHGSAAELIDTIRSAARGELQCSPRVAAALMQRVARLAAGRRAHRAVPCLTEREEEIVRLLDQGLTNKQIAQRLHIATATVRNHVHHILEKLGARTRGEAAARARRAPGP